MHPIERLRYVARAEGADPGMLVSETASALADVIRSDPAGVVPACRRLIDRHLTVGPMWWLAARVLTAADPVAEAWLASAEIEADDTVSRLVSMLPDDGLVTVVGWPDLAAQALRRRGDLEVLVVDGGGYGATLARRLDDVGVVASLVPDAGAAAAAAVSDLVLVEGVAGGPSGLLATTGSHGAAAAAAYGGVTVWGVAGVGRVLPVELWDVLLARLDDRSDEPWERPEGLVPAGLLDAVITSTGLVVTADALGHSTAPVAAELLRQAG